MKIGDEIMYGQQPGWISESGSEPGHFLIGLYQQDGYVQVPAEQLKVVADDQQPDDVIAADLTVEGQTTPWISMRFQGQHRQHILHLAETTGRPVQDVVSDVLHAALENIPDQA